MFKELNETMPGELKESMRTMSKQIEKINNDKEIKKEPNRKSVFEKYNK